MTNIASDVSTCPNCDAVVFPGASDCAKCGVLFDALGQPAPSSTEHPSPERILTWRLRGYWIYLALLVTVAIVGTRLTYFPGLYILVWGLLISPLYGVSELLLRERPFQTVRYFKLVLAPLALTVLITVALLVRSFEY
jgi:hypothetical protein